MDGTDLIILGGGLAGLCAAVEAGERGATVLLLEKEAKVGGSSLLSGRYMAFAGTDMQKERGIEDSSLVLVDDMLDVGGGVNDQELVEAYGNYQLETYQWLVDHGILFKSLQAVSGHSAPRGHTIDSDQAIGVLYQRAEQLPNVTIRLQAPAKRLLQDATGRIDSVYYEVNGEGMISQADKGVMLTSGGFSQSEELLSHFAPQLSRALRIGGPGNEGDGLMMAWEHGAWIRDLPYLNGTYGFHPTANGPVKHQGLVFYKGAIIVNKYGNRFVDESLSYKLLGSVALKQPDDLSYQIWDQTVMDKSVAGDKLYDFENLLQQGLVYQANTITELARIIDLDPSALQKTVSKYNQGVVNGSDQFGRKTLTHRYGELTTIANGPFYAFRTTVAMLATYAGIAVNTLGQVVNPFKEPISGLYAAGEIVGGFHGAGYMTGSSLGKAAVFGRIGALTALGIEINEGADKTETIKSNPS
ncbi:FAD-dependent oxidoreductase [Aquibacillus saliphilus]|uniref:FAD-dependent oxidoreductase n=1 Tax=Aquibacillus saliphilus TaxID=1909422 RepID=UPI001CF01AF5|nr:FAD-dependent oxidoreductase [Aquibacillus saliphilus]